MIEDEYWRPVLPAEFPKFVFHAKFLPF